MRRHVTPAVRPYDHTDINKAIAAQQAAMGNVAPSIAYHLPPPGSGFGPGTNPFAFPSFPGSGGTPLPNQSILNTPDSSSGMGSSGSGNPMTGGDPYGSADQPGATGVSARTMGQLLSLGTGGALPSSVTTPLLNAYNTANPQYNLTMNPHSTTGMFSATPVYHAPVANPGNTGPAYFGPSRTGVDGNQFGTNFLNDFGRDAQSYYNMMNPNQGLGGNNVGFGDQYTPGTPAGPGYGGWQGATQGGFSGGGARQVFGSTSSPWDWGGGDVGTPYY